MFVSGLGLRLMRIMIDPMLSRDSLWYLRLAREIGQTSWTQTLAANPKLFEFYPPLIFSVMAAGEYCGLGAHLSGMIFCMSASLLLPVAPAMIAWELFDDWRYAAGAMLLCTVSPPMIRLSNDVLREVPYWCFCSFAVAFAVRGTNRQGFGSWFWFAIFAALAILTRREGVELLILVVPTLLMGWKSARLMVVLRRKVWLCGLILAVLTAVLAPVQLSMLHVGSKWQILPWHTAKKMVDRMIR